MKVADNTKKKEAQRISNPPSPQLLTLKQAAEYLGLTVWALRERVWAGTIPFVKFPEGRKIYIRTKDLDEFIEDNTYRHVEPGGEKQ